MGAWREAAPELRGAPGPRRPARRRLADAAGRRGLCVSFPRQAKSLRLAHVLLTPARAYLSLPFTVLIKVSSNETGV